MKGILKWLTIVVLTALAACTVGLDIAVDTPTIAQPIEDTVGASDSPEATPTEKPPSDIMEQKEDPTTPTSPFELI